MRLNRQIFSIICIVISRMLVAQNAPMAHFVAADTAICGNIYTESFTDHSTNHPVSWKWYFPGAIPDTSTLQNPINIQYKGFGCYSVKLVVKNNYGLDSLMESNYICLDSSPHITLTGDLRVCTNTPFKKDTIIAHGGNHYLWMNGDTTAYFIFTTGDDYFYVKVTVYNGACSKDTTIPIRYDTMPTFVFKGDTALCRGDTTTIYAKSRERYKYLWSTGSTSDSITVAGITTGSYNYYVTITNGACVNDSSQVSVRIEDCTGVDNYDDPLEEVRIYPNPSKGTFIFQTNSQQLITNIYIEIYNVLGQQVFKSTINSDNIEINLTNHPQGVYLYRVITETGTLIGEGKVLIQR